MSLLEPEPQPPTSAFTLVTWVLLAGIVIVAAIPILGRLGFFDILLIIVVGGSWAISTFTGTGGTDDPDENEDEKLITLDLGDASSSLHSPAAASAEERMRQLDRLRREGLIDEDDYYWKRDEILRDL